MSRLPCACGCGKLVGDTEGITFKNLVFDEDGSISFKEAIVRGMEFHDLRFNSFEEIMQWIRRQWSLEAQA